MNILLPVAGRSSRYPNMRPKWLLTNPNGNLMIVDSIIGLELEKIDNIYLVYLKEHQEIFKFKDGLIRNLKKYNLDTKLVFIELETQTRNQVDTIRQGLMKLGTIQSMLIKDCDNSFKLKIQSLDTNFISYCELSNDTNDVSSKSYLELDNMNVITNIVEKKIISNKFCSGAYYFTNSDEFLTFSNIDNDDLYVSDVVFNMMLNKKQFIGIESLNYEDWGTIESWIKYKETFTTLFVDIDGTLFKNSSNYVHPYIGSTEVLNSNVNFLKKYISTKRTEVILTTSRPEEYREITEKQLQDCGIFYKQLIMGLQHCKRVIINDFSGTNPYPSCEAINIQRDTDSLHKYLKI